MRNDTMPMILLRWITIVAVTAIFCTTVLRGQTYNYSDWFQKYGIEQHTFDIGDTLTFKVSGLVCSFCAHGLNKGIGKLDYTDKNNVFVDINNQTVKVVVLKEPNIEETIKLIKSTGYDVSRITRANEVIWKKEK
jgi:copper chaperone CopZ